MLCGGNMLSGGKRLPSDDNQRNTIQGDPDQP